MTSISLAFIIERTAEYRYLGSVIEAAIACGHDVTLWLDYAQPREGGKAYQFPAVESIPDFKTDAPKSITYEGEEGLRELLSKNLAECVVASRGSAHYLPTDNTVAEHMPWVSVQEHFDFVMFGLDKITGSTLNCAYSPFWLDVIEQLYAQPSERENLRFQVEAGWRETGCCQADGVRHIDPQQVRAKWNIPSDRPVVVYLPTNQGQMLFLRVFRASSRWLQAAHILRDRRWRVLPYLLQPFSDKALVDSVRRFCDANGAYLLVKSREKTPIPDYLKAAADKIVMDDTEYPASILRAMSVADLCISAYPSDSVSDAAAVGVPMLNLFRDADDWSWSYRGKGFVRTPEDIYYTPRFGGPYNYPGFAYARPLLDAIKNLPFMKLSDFALDEDARRRYIEQYLGHADGLSGQRVIKEVEALMARLTNRRDVYAYPNATS
ncbi:MAG: hypothetical protein IIB15_02800 [Chloroflexi bacterium]|nr:hypothetical protein [Chloroflexota bacterium]